MAGIPAYVLIGIMVAISAVAIWINHLWERRRREAMLALANDLGWRFDPVRDRLHDDEYANFEIFRSGHSRAALNTLTGAIELFDEQCPAKMGDFTYKVTSGSGKNRRTRTYYFSYLIVHLPFTGAPPLLIRPEGLFDKVAGVFGFADINFESAEFSRRFHVKSPDRKFAYDVISQRMMEFLLKTDAPTVDIEHGRCCLSDGTKRWEPAEFRTRVNWLESFFAHWPNFVASDLASRTEAELGAGELR